MVLNNMTQGVVLVDEISAIKQAASLLEVVLAELDDGLLVELLHGGGVSAGGQRDADVRVFGAYRERKSHDGDQQQASWSRHHKPRNSEHFDAAGQGRLLGSVVSG